MPNYKFEVRLDNMNLTKSKVKEINEVINSAIGKSIVNYGLQKEPLGSRLRLNKEWLGIWVKRFDRPELLAKSEIFQQFK
jgi:hypothetical protein